MNDHAVDPAQVAVIETRIDQAFAFAQDVIESPELLDVIPDGATLSFRDVVYQGITLRLTAHPDQSRSGWWTARITGPASIAVPARGWMSPDQSECAGELGNALVCPESASTAEKALDALQQKLSELLASGLGARLGVQAR